jgi:hypothetical protein
LLRFGWIASPVASPTKSRRGTFPILDQSYCRFRVVGRRVLGLAALALLAVTALTAVASVPASAYAPRIHKPGAPTAVTAIALSGGAEVSWTAPASDGGSPITGYTVISWHGGQTCSTTGATTCTVTGLANGRSYTLHVRASNIAGNGRPSTVRVSLLPAVSFASSVFFT